MATNMVQLDPVQQYFSELAQFPPLTDEEVQALSEQIAQARKHQQPHLETQARHQLVEGLLTEVLPTAQKYAARMQRMTLLDLIQQGNYGLLMAAERYDFNDTTRPFGAYALSYIRALIKRDLHTATSASIPNGSFYWQRARGRLDPVLSLAPLSLDALRGADEEEYRFHDLLAAPPLRLASEPVVTPDAPSTSAYVEGLLTSLPTREQRVLRLRYGLDEQDGRTLDREDLAQELGLTAVQVATIEARALRRLRQGTGIGYSTASVRMQQYHRRRHEEQQARLQAAYHRLQEQGQPITAETLSAAAHADNRAAAVFLRSCSQESAERARIRSLPSQQRLEEAYAQMVERGDCLSITGLQAAAHINAPAARAFLRSRGVPRQLGGPPRKASHAVSKEISQS